jgi:hypothetical protein
MSGTFSRFQPVYAEHRIPTFPVTPEKTPATRGYLRTGLRGSAELARKFPDADAFGFACGPRTKITLLDVDSADERALADALSIYGRTPLISRTASGGYHAWFRYSGETRRIRPLPDKPFFDILGGGFAVAPPSHVAKGSYEFVEGNLDDLDHLPTMVASYDHPAPITGSFPALTPSFQQGSTGHVPEGRRNLSLWGHCMRQAHHCDDFDTLVDCARTFNENCEPPLDDSEVMNVASSAWSYTERGANRFGQHGAWFPMHEITKLLRDQDAMVLLAFLRAHNGPWATFMCANGLAETFGWPRKRLAAARRRLIELGYIQPVRTASGSGSSGLPALFRWK